ncbi:DUF262 domain-containing protein [Salinibacter ruber]|uniref:DUF262 domain-containing protein n=1 Tax=Salinibacter ruber TaxID=146919 RepID=UPI002168BE8B|nr:DUF262 domain-containing protein [Salinibacter ruber]MCS4099938.1 hypothetical protein [Salinibacter ruber]
MSEGTYYDRISLKRLFRYHDENKLLLPNFQRNFVWKPEQQEALLASLIVGIPVGAILILEGSEDSFGYRKLSRTERSDVDAEEPVWYLLDGQQRMSTLHTILNDSLGSLEEWKENWDSIFYHLKLRWFLKILPEEEGVDPFGFKELNFKNKFYGSNPEDVTDYIEYKRVYSTKKSRWYHPEYLQNKEKEFQVAEEDGQGMEEVEYERLDPKRRKLETARLFARKGYVPLFDVWNTDSSDRPLHLLTLRQMARQRADELRDEVGDDEDKIVELLQSTDVSPREALQRGDEEAISLAWNTKATDWAGDVTDFLESLLEVKIPHTRLPEDEIDRGIAIFEQMNTGGTELDTYDLIVARAARHEDYRGEQSLSKRVAGQLSSGIELPDSLTEEVHADEEIPDNWSPVGMDVIEDNSPSSRVRDEYLSFLSILSDLEYGDLENLTGDHTRSKKIMNLSTQDINEWSSKAVISLKRALCFLQFRCGIVSVKDVRYRRMILPIGYLFREDSNWEDKETHKKAEYWYWSSILGGAYKYEKNRVSINDITDLYKWATGEIDNPFQDRENSFFESGDEDEVFESKDFSDLETLVGYYDEETESYVTAPRPVVDTLLQYVLSRCPKDFLPDDKNEIRLCPWRIAGGQKVKISEDEEEELDLHDHHIYPLSGATSLGDSSKDIRKMSKSKGEYHKLNSVLNRTYISDIANRIISDKKPDEYMKDIPHVSVVQHLIPTPFDNVYDSLEEEDYESVLMDRYRKISDKILEELDGLK